MCEVIRWISIVLMWIAVGMNLYAMTRCNRTYKKLQREYDYLEKICKEYEAMRNKYIELLSEQWKEVSDDGEN